MIKVKKTVKRMRENMKYIGLMSIIFAITLIGVSYMFPVIYSYITSYITEVLLEKKWGLLFGAITLQSIMWIISTLLKAYEQNLKQRTVTKSTNHSMLKIREKMCDLSISFFDEPGNLNLLNRANESAYSYIYFKIFRDLITLFTIVISLVLSITPLADILPISLPIIIILCIINMFIAAKCNDIEYLSKVRELEPERRRWYYKSLFYNKEKIKEVKSFNIEDWVLSKYTYISKKIFRNVSKMNIHSSIIVAATDLFFMVVKIFIYIYVVNCALDGKVSVSSCVLFIGLWDNAIQLVENLRYTFMDISMDVKGIKDINAFLDYEVNNKSSCEIGVINCLDFKNVKFAYITNSSAEILKNINLHFEKGKCYLLLGENGAGKSTIVKLILKQYSSYEGDILLEGDKDLKEINLRDINKIRVGYMAQDDMHYSMSIKDNIIFGAEYEEEKLKQCIEKAGLQQLTDSLSDGMDTLLGKEYDNGRELSGGQWQRISFARLLYNDSDIIILDEPSSNLDPILERKLYEEIKNIFGDKIVILISHRLSSISIADEIIFIDDGEVIGCGTHKELIDNCGKYKELCGVQQQIMGGIF